jgi:hypothetical protein
MIRSIRRFAAVLLASLAVALPAHATTFSVDFTDIWWNASEDGWGVTVSQQGDTIFVTFFIYGTDRTPRWYSGAIFPTAGPANAATFTGDLVQSTGSYFGDSTFTKSPGIKVGTVTMTFTSPSAATLAYNINGVSVTKQIVRQTFRGNNLAGNYSGGLVSDRTGCRDSTQNGFADVTGPLTVTHAEPSVVMQVDFSTSTSSGACVYRGNYVAQGRVGTISNGTWSCAVGGTTLFQGNFTMTNIDGQANGFNAAFAATDTGSCVYNGRFGGVRYPQ